MITDYFNAGYIEENFSEENFGKKVGSNDEGERKILKNNNKENLMHIGSRSKIIKKYSCSLHQYIIKKVHKNVENFLNEDKFYQFYKKKSSKYASFVKTKKDDQEKHLDQTLALDIKLSACKFSLRELLDSLKNLGLEKSFERIFNYFEQIKKEIALHKNTLKSDKKILLNILENRIFVPFKELISSFKKNVAFYFLNTCEKILKDLNILHSNLYCHLDLKPENIVLNSFKEAFLIDFESATSAININKQNKKLIFTKGYADKEIYNENHLIEDGRRCDSFSFSKIIDSIINLLKSLNSDENNDAIIFFEKLKNLLMIKKTPITKVINLIKVFKLNHPNNFQSNSLEFYFNFILDTFLKNDNKGEFFLEDYQRIKKKGNNYLDQVKFFNENAYLSFMSINKETYNHAYNHILDLKISLAEYPIFYFYVYGQKNITFPRLLQILGHFYFYLNRYSEACCFLRSAVKLYEKEMKNLNMENHELYFEACIMLAKAYLSEDNAANNKKFNQLKTKIENCLKHNSCEDYRYTMILALEEEKNENGKVEKKKELLIRSFDQLKKRDPTNKNIVNIIDSILEIEKKEEIDKWLNYLDTNFDDLLSLSTIYKCKMLVAYERERKEEAINYYEKVIEIYNELGIRKNHPLIFFMNFMKCSIILRFKETKWNLLDVFIENDNNFKFDQDYRLDDKGRDYNIRIKTCYDMYNEDIESLKKQTQDLLKSMKNNTIIAYTYLNMGWFFGKNGDDQKRIGNEAKSREFWEESVKNFSKSREYYFKKYEENSDDTIWTDTLNAEVLLKLNRVKEAQTTIAKPYQDYPIKFGNQHSR